MVPAQGRSRYAIAGGQTLKVLYLLVAMALAPAAATAQGIITGSVRDNHGGVLPGVAVVASSAERRGEAVTDSSGCYQLTGLAAGTYSVTAALAGFVTGRREHTVVTDARSTEPLDFTLCIAALEEIDWPVPSLMEMWKQSDVVAHVRITQTRIAVSECPTKDFEQMATLIEVFKDSAKRPSASTLTFVQENWRGERTPYPKGDNIVVFLVATSQGFRRIAGPHSVFLLKGDHVISSLGGVNGMTVADFTAQLRAFAKEFERR